MSKPTCRHCAAGLQLFKCCQKLSAGTVLQRCSCLSGIKTYLPALCCRGAAVEAASKPICRHCVAEVQLFKRCPNLSAGHCAAGVQLFKRCRNLSAGLVLQGCSCLSCVETYLPALCCRGAAVKVVSKPIYRHCVAEVQLFKWCQNLSAGTVLQRCSCLSVVKHLCRHCVAEVQLFKRCPNLSAGTVLQGCSCLSSVST